MGAVMSKIDDAYIIYTNHIYDEEKIALLKKHKLKVAGSVPSVMWELFCAVLTGRSGVGSKGADLAGWEVKSAKKGSSFEYQYHLNSGIGKLKEDYSVNHLFCSYSVSYADVVVRAIKGKDLADSFFKKWKPEYLENYDSSLPANMRRQRFRKNIPYNHVETHGKIILKIKDGEMIEKNDLLLTKLNSNKSK